MKVSLGSVETDLLTVKEQLNQPQTQEGGTQTTDIDSGSESYSLDLVPIGEFCNCNNNYDNFEK